MADNKLNSPAKRPQARRLPLGLAGDLCCERLVGATGRRESAEDPALASRLSEAQNYVKGYMPATHGKRGQDAIARGLPVTLVPLPPLDGAGNDLGREAMLQMGQPYGDDAVPGGGDAGAANGTLKTSFSSQSWSGPRRAPSA